MLKEVRKKQRITSLGTFKWIWFFYIVLGPWPTSWRLIKTENKWDFILAKWYKWKLFRQCWYLEERIFPMVVGCVHPESHRLRWLVNAQAARRISTFYLPADNDDGCTSLKKPLHFIVIIIIISSCSHGNIVALEKWIFHQLWVYIYKA